MSISKHFQQQANSKSWTPVVILIAIHQHIRLFRILFTNFLEFTQIPVPCRDHGDTEERRHGRSGARRDWQKPEITECFTRMQ